MIDFSSENVKIPDFIDESVAEWITKIINEYSRITGDINYLFCDDSYILEVNKRYLNHNYFTDIVTFDYCKSNIISGDLIISIDTVKTNSLLYNTTFTEELLRVIIHGILHLVGFKDHTDDEKKQMRELENKALKLFPTFN